MRAATYDHDERQRLYQRPIDVGLSPDSTRIVVKAGHVAGIEAVFEQSAPGNAFQVPQSVRFVQGGVLDEQRERTGLP